MATSATGTVAGGASGGGGSPTGGTASVGRAPPRDGRRGPGGTRDGRIGHIPIGHLAPLAAGEARLPPAPGCSSCGSGDHGSSSSSSSSIGLPLLGPVGIGPTRVGVGIAARRRPPAGPRPGRHERLGDRPVDIDVARRLPGQLPPGQFHLGLLPQPPLLLLPQPPLALPPLLLLLHGPDLAPPDARGTDDAVGRDPLVHPAVVVPVVDVVLPPLLRERMVGTCAGQPVDDVAEQDGRPLGQIAALFARPDGGGDGGVGGTDTTPTTVGAGAAPVRHVRGVAGIFVVGTPESTATATGGLAVVVIVVVGRIAVRRVVRKLHSRLAVRGLFGLRTGVQDLDDRRPGERVGVDPLGRPFALLFRFGRRSAATAAAGDSRDSGSSGATASGASTAPSCTSAAAAAFAVGSDGGEAAAGTADQLGGGAARAGPTATTRWWGRTGIAHGRGRRGAGPGGRSSSRWRLVTGGSHDLNGFCAESVLCWRKSCRLGLPAAWVQNSSTQAHNRLSRQSKT
mmetsp:Transcript_30925/g.90406  ORF Transcript_30925/g.90406 Transcript_30925/m.90406 type:complete len:511 (+) Transcript_30925:2095-3627(+)